MRDSQESKGGDFGDMPKSRERELVESSTNRRKAIKWKSGVDIPLLKIPTPNFFYPNDLQGLQFQEEKLRESKSHDCKA